MTKPELETLKALDEKFVAGHKYMRAHDIKAVKFEFNYNELILLDRLITMRLLEEQL